MRITIINFNAEISGEGSRVLAAILRQRGHHVRLISTPQIGNQPLTVDMDAWISEFGDSQALLLSFMSPYLTWAIHVTEYLRRELPHIPLVWGGVHPSAMPEDSMRYVDYLGRMECEEALPEFLERMEGGEDLTAVRNFWVRDKDGVIHRNDLRPAIQDLDSIPPPEYKLEDEWILHQGNLVPMTEELLVRYHTEYYFGHPTYISLTTRGCPFMCAYCFNSQLVAAYNSRKIRYRDLDRVIHEEIKPALKRFPFFKSVGFSDDDFFHIKREVIERFCETWKREVNLPFAVTTSPVSCKPDKLEMLVDAGLKVVQMGVQTGSERLNKEVNNRKSSNERTLKALEVLNRYAKDGTIKVNCDFILDNPYETDEDILLSIDHLKNFPPKIWLNLFSLAFYPGTALYDRALTDGIISDSYDVFSRAFNIGVAHSHRYLTYVFLLKSVRRDRMSDLLLNMLTSPLGRFIGNRLPRWLLNGVWGQKIFPRIGVENPTA
jgi:anaerobic magnesium-protoporphyrin IX monomethyl ester cyclase